MPSKAALKRRPATRAEHPEIPALRPPELRRPDRRRRSSAAGGGARIARAIRRRASGSGGTSPRRRDDRRRQLEANRDRLAPGAPCRSGVSDRDPVPPDRAPRRGAHRESMRGWRESSRTTSRSTCRRTTRPSGGPLALELGQSGIGGRPLRNTRGEKTNRALHCTSPGKRDRERSASSSRIQRAGRGTQGKWARLRGRRSPSSDRGKKKNGNMYGPQKASSDKTKAIDTTKKVLEAGSPDAGHTRTGHEKKIFDNRAPKRTCS